MIYIFISILIIIGIWLYDFRKNYLINNQKKYYWFLFLVLALVAGLRYRIGTDTITYEAWFESNGLPTLDKLTVKDFDHNRFEPLFVLFGVTIKSLFGNNWIAFQLVHAFFVNFAFFWAIKKYSPAPFIGIAIYYLSTFYALNCEVMRQSLATAVLVFSLPYLFNKHYVKYFSIVLVAFFIHRTSFLFFLLPFITFLRSTKVLVLSVLSFGISATILSQFVTNYFFDILLLFQSYDSFFLTLDNYSDLERLTAYNFTIFGILSFFMSTIVLYIICKIKGDERVIVKKDINGLCEYDMSKMGHLLSFYIIMQTLSYALPIFYRFAWVLFLFPIFYLSSFILIMFKSRQPENRILLGMVLLLFVFKVVSDNFHEEKDMEIYYYQRYMPYSSVFDQKKDKDRETIFMIYNK